MGEFKGLERKTRARVCEEREGSISPLKCKCHAMAKEIAKEREKERFTLLSLEDSWRMS